MTPKPPPASTHNRFFAYRAGLDRPVVGIESEFSVYVDDIRVVPDDFWRHPNAFMNQPLMMRTKKSSQLPNGGAIYFDEGVIELVTPVIELAPECTARAVRNLWEQIAFTRAELDGWESRTGKHVRLEGFSSHYNISFDVPPAERSRDRTIQKLAVLLAHLLPIPVILVGANRRSTGVGVRPRRDRLEVTLDFTPDPALMLATAALIVGITREVIGWPSYKLTVLDSLPLEIPRALQPGKHTSRKGWLAREDNFGRNPFEAVNERSWETRNGKSMSMRAMAALTVQHFASSIRHYADPFSWKVLEAVVKGDAPSLLELPDRPAGYEDVGRKTRWGLLVPELQLFASGLAGMEGGTRHTDLDSLAPPWRGAPADRRLSGAAGAGISETRKKERRRIIATRPPQKVLSRSAYERVFLKLASGSSLELGGETLTPIGMKGWYQAMFRRETDGEVRMISIDELVKTMDRGEWNPVS